jgi:FKBP-type peptidyl-prolyl cis-trans isomerase SlyD
MTSQLSHVADNHVVSIHYRLTNDSGEVLDESGDSPLEYLHGNGNIVPGLERELAGKPLGFEQTVKVAPEDGYGVRDERGVKRVPREAFPPDVEVQAGMEFVAQGPNGARAIVRVTDVLEEEVEVDLNHPLAGTTLHFDVKVVGIRAATETELTHGHVHGSGGCGAHGGCGGQGAEHGECCGGKKRGEPKDCAEDGSCCGGHGC